MQMDKKEFKLPPHLARGPIAWMACNPVAANLLMLALLVGGFIMSLGVQKDIYPQFALNEIKISIAYPGGTAAEIEKSVVQTIEQAIENVDNVKKTEALITPGAARLTITIEEKADAHKALQDVKAEIDRITTFPEDAEKPEISLSATTWKVLTLLLTGTDDIKALNYWTNIIKDELARAPEISSVMIEGLRDLEVHVEISQDNLRRYGLKLDEIAAIINQNALEQGGGTVKTSGGDIMIHLDERRDYAADFTDIAVRTNADGSRLFLEDIATIKDGFENIYSWAEFNGQPAISLNVFKTAEQDPIAAVEATLQIVDNFNESLPADLTLNIRDISADIYRNNQKLLLSNALMGIVLVFICLTVFLRPSLALWVSLGIPVAIIGSFWFFAPFGVTVNMLSMFAFIVTLGVVVDDAIIIGENTSAWQERGVAPLEAAVRGVKGVARPVIFSILTNVVAFLPILFVPGTVGNALTALPLVVIAVLSCSLLESLFILPPHLAHGRPKEKFTRKGEFDVPLKQKSSKRSPLQYFNQRQELFSAKVKWFAENHFGQFLHKALTYRYITLAIGLAILLITIGYVASGRLGFELISRTDADFASAKITFPAGSSLAEIDRMKSQLEKAAQKVIAENGGDSLARGIYTNIDGKNSQISTQVFLEDPAVRPITTAEFTEKWRAETGNIMGAENTEMSSDEGNLGAGKGITVHLFHRNNQILDEAAQKLGASLASFPAISDINTGVSQTKREFNIKLNAVRLRR